MKSPSMLFSFQFDRINALNALYFWLFHRNSDYTVSQLIAFKFIMMCFYGSLELCIWIGFFLVVGVFFRINRQILFNFHVFRKELVEHNFFFWNNKWKRLTKPEYDFHVFNDYYYYYTQHLIKVIFYHCVQCFCPHTTAPC